MRILKSSFIAIVGCYVAVSASAQSQTPKPSPAQVQAAQAPRPNPLMDKKLYMKRMEKVFDTLDKDGDGKLDYVEHAARASADAGGGRTASSEGRGDDKKKPVAKNVAPIDPSDSDGGGVVGIPPINADQIQK